VCALSLLSCAPEKIKQYRVAKVSEPPQKMAAPAATQSAPFLFKIPAGWQTQASSGMRAASFQTEGGGDVSVVTLPGMAGDLKGNLNRWRGQVGLEPLADEAAIQKSFQPFKMGTEQALALELASPEGKPDKAMRVALLEKEGVTWFFKLAGTRQVVEKQKTAFEDFLGSVQFKPGGNMPPAAADAPPADTSGMGAGSLPPITPQATDTKLTYALPSAWKEKPASSMRIASFEVKSGQQTGDISIVSLAGDGGGLLSNTNRWRRQLEMAPTDQAGLQNLVKDIQIDGHKGYFMALYTGMEGQGMLVALVEQGGQTWFIKMVAPSQLAHAQEQDFLKFVQSIQFHAKGSQT